MKKQAKSINEINRMDNLALTGVINFWKDYTPETIAVAVEELNRRNYRIDEDLQQRINRFISTNQVDNVHEVTLQYLEGTGYSTYIDYYNSLFKQNEVVEQTLNEPVKSIQKSRLNQQANINPSKLVSAGRALKKVVWIVVGLLSVSLIFGLIALNSSSFQTITTLYIIIGFLTLIGNIIILYNLFQAGDYLEDVLD
jgi:hypothetical protein